MTKGKFSVALVILALLNGCASGRGRPDLPQAQVERALRTAAGEAQPSRIVAAEIALARASQESGQWTAFRTFAAAGAILHGQKGGIDAANLLSGRADPPAASKWAPRAIWMSCDGALALSEGRYRETSGTVGVFVTLWRRQDDLSYRWLYHARTADEPQPPTPAADSEVDENAIVVTALDAVQGLVADCRRPAPPLPDALTKRRAEMTGWTSPDGSLSFAWEHRGTERRMTADWLFEGRWQTALDHVLPTTPAGPEYP